VCRLAAGTQPGVARELDGTPGWREIAGCALSPETAVNEETFNLSIRKFLKLVGVQSQREIELAVDQARKTGRIQGSESFPAVMNLHVEGLGIDVKFDGQIKLE
jgi:hypothetical protein